MPIREAILAKLTRGRRERIGYICREVVREARRTNNPLNGRTELVRRIADVMLEHNIVLLRYNNRVSDITNWRTMTSLDVFAEVAVHMKVVDEVQAQVQAQGVQASLQQRAQIDASLQAQADARQQAAQVQK